MVTGNKKIEKDPVNECHVVIPVAFRNGQQLYIMLTLGIFNMVIIIVASVLPTSSKA